MSLAGQVNSLATEVGGRVKTLNAARQLPSFLPTTLKNSFDPTTSLYNWKPSNTHKFRAAMIKAAYANAKAEIVVAGDSFAAGCTASSPSLVFDRPNSFPYATRKQMGRLGIPECGTGLVRATDAGLATDSRWSYNVIGNWNATGKFYAFTSTQNEWAQFTSDVAGTKVALTYVDHNDSATFTMAVDGASSGAGFSGTITNNGGSVAVKQLVLTTAVNVGSTIRMTKTSAGVNYLDIIGVQVWDDTRGGVIVHNLSQSGATASGTGAAAWADASASTALGTMLTNLSKITAGATANPDLLVIQLGGNDHPVPSGADSTHALYSTVTSALQTIRGRSTGDAVLVMSGQLVDSVVPQANWEGYITACYQLADTLDIPLVDCYSKMGSYTQCVSDGWVTDGQGHWSSPAYRFIGHMMAQGWAGEFGDVKTPQVATVPSGTTGFTTVPDGTLWVEYTP